MGPGGGNAGGQCVFAGPPSESMNSDASLTGMHLKAKFK